MKNARATRCNSFWIVLLLFLGAPMSSGGAQSPPRLKITAPTDGTVVTAGQKLTVTVTSPAGLSFSQVGIIAGDPLGFGPTATSVPASLTLEIPANIPIGKYNLSAVGITTSGQGVESGIITISVERSDVPTQLSADPKRLSLALPGLTSYLSISGSFADGNTLQLTDSANLSYRSTDTTIATVSSTGAVTGVGVGNCVVFATYANGPSVAVPVSVLPAPLSSAPASLTFGAQGVGTQSEAQILTLTNVSKNGGMSITSVSVGPDFLETDNCAASSPLAVGNSCTVNVTFAPTNNGFRSGSLTVYTSSLVSPFSVPLAGTGRGQVILTETTLPSSGIGGHDIVYVTGTRYPSGTTPASNVTISFAASCGGPPIVATHPAAFTNPTGSTWRAQVPLPLSLPAGTFYVSVNGSTSSGALFASYTCSSVTVTTN